MVSELNLLRDKLDQPEKLKLLVEEFRQKQNLSEEVLGFIALYDSLNGDNLKMKALLEENKKQILMSLQKKPLFFCRKTVLKYAAVFLILAASSVFLYARLSKPHFELSVVFKDPGIPSYMSSDAQNTFELIMYNYKLKDFDKASELLQVAIQSDPKNDTLIYYYGVATYQSEHLDKAKLNFYKLTLQKGPYQHRSYYYLGVCFVKEGKYKEAIKAFESVVNSQDEAVYMYASDNLKELKNYLTKQQ
jgi:tetratricopeptide (TPR) repeat protein